MRNNPKKRNGYAGVGYVCLGHGFKKMRGL